MVNPDRLEAALDCLLENAIKFTTVGDRIAVVGTSTAAGWMIEIIDSGVGLAEGQAETLMAAPVPLPTTSGTGLGHAVVPAGPSAAGGQTGRRTHPRVSQTTPYMTAP